MDHFLEIRLLPDVEFGETLLMSELFSKFHRALIVAGHGHVGISFPSAKKTLGDILRLHGKENALQKLMSWDWLSGLKAYVEVSEVMPVPKQCRYRTVKRVQGKGSLQRLLRRSIRKGWISVEEAAQRTQKEVQKLNYPFVQLKSGSTGQSFPLFIQQCAVQDNPREGLFSTYGLSSSATVPWF